MIAAGKGHISAVAFLIQHGAIMDLQDGNAETALHHAVLFSLRKIWDPKRFGFGANYINSGYRNNSQIPLKILAEKDRVSVATFLIAVIEHGANVDLQDKNGLSPLHYAASHSDVLLEISKNLIEIGADENKCAKIKSSLLMIACKYSCLNAVHFLIECGANMAFKDSDGYTALHHACNSHYVKCLIQSGADVNLLNAVTFLTEHGANMALKDSDGYIALHHASNSHYSHEILKCLIQSGADVNACTKTKSTPLMMACKCGLLNAVTFLTEHGANMALKDSDGYTALHHTCNSHSHHSITLLSYLIENGADINDCTNDDYTPLMVAAQKGDINAVTSLVECGANVHHRDRDGRTALHFAIYYISPASIVEVSSSLIKYGATPTICNETLLIS